MDARPSDSLALAVRARCPIYIDEKVLKQVPAAQEGVITKEEVEKFKETLKTMSPEEFFKQLEETPPAEGPESEEGRGWPPFESNEDENQEEGDDEEDDEEHP